MRSDCPISCTLDVLGDKWSLLIMRDLLFFEINSFGEFLLSDEKIARTILADRLEDLVENGFIVKEVSPVNKSKFLYYPTQKGVDLVPLLLQLADWSEKYQTAVVNPKMEVAAFKNSKGKAMQQLRMRIRN
ncbi:winged helix-turn-helix transcriptional regulator [Chitinophaga sp. YR627]|uniref:winged helix-turn-helix transcriptional regulator n=1 Tax=Chitinophaga sp. YR627 TaxID=1881041 RepID=UPI001C434EA4|nr:helix-turn-helix domain-containing protein [Chitinophaga sp. YR627]